MMTNWNECCMGTKDLSFQRSHFILRGTFSPSTHLGPQLLLTCLILHSTYLHTSPPKYSQVFSFNVIFVLNPHEG